MATSVWLFKPRQRSTVRHLVKQGALQVRHEGSPAALYPCMPLPTSNPGALITAVGGIQSCRRVFLVTIHGLCGLFSVE